MHVFEGDFLSGLETSAANVATKGRPATIYHYTDSSGLIGILQEDPPELWYTDYRYLNDPNELRYGIGTTTAILSEIKDGWAPDVIAKMNNFKPPNAIYICSFSEDEDSLSQWREYARTDGFSIGFDVTGAPRLFDWDRDKPDIPPRLTRVIYRRDEQAEVLNNFLGVIRNRLEECDPDEDQWKAAIQQIEIWMWYHAIMFKDKAFETEKEWRIVDQIDETVIKQKKNLKFRKGKYGLTPYISKEAPPIRSIRSGPGANHQLSSRAAKLLVERCMEKHVDFTNTDVEY